MKHYIRKILLCTLLAFLLTCSAMAATLSEMKENGEVSDGPITHGNMRDGVVSDVSDSGEGLMPEMSSVFDGIVSGSEDPSDTADPFFTDSVTERPETSRVTSDMTTDNGTAGTDKADSGMGLGLVVAILVVVAVIVIIIILLPKRR